MVRAAERPTQPLADTSHERRPPRCGTRTSPAYALCGHASSSLAPVEEEHPGKQPVQWPERRKDVLESLRALGDRDYQGQHWRSGEGWPDLTAAVHWLIDDTFIDQHGRRGCRLAHAGEWRSCARRRRDRVALVGGYEGHRRRVVTGSVKGETLPVDRPTRLVMTDGRPVPRGRPCWAEAVSCTSS